MQRQLQEEKVFKDPVHHSVYVHDMTIWKLINTPEFQRLRRIRQLGTTYLTFHGAEHSRFSHSLGVYEITRKIINQFERNGYKDWPQEEKLVSLCASLLHDVGHGPFSHAIEHVFQTDHEKWTCDIVLGDTSINRVLREAGEEFPDKVASVIRKTYDKPIVVSLVSSQMDADRMDYLLRDAYFTGVNYGSFDLDRLLRVMRPHKDAIVVKESGMHAVEAYLMARYQMYWQVYFHPVTRSSDMLLRQIFRRAGELYQSGYRFAFLLPQLAQLFERKMTVDAYLSLDDSIVQTAFNQWIRESDELLSDLCRRFLHRQLYKYITVESIDEAFLNGLREEWLAIGLNPEYHLEVDTPIDLPYDVYKPGTAPDAKDKPPILILDEKDRVSEISARSDIIKSIAGLHQGKYAIYYPEEELRERASRLKPSTRELFGL
ncbi:HD domain-containing protein [Cohnella lubricantis]|uniref:HD domain-containing protein n=1 Tax=Cohnella lubricantis TaxID=2163172 RepID=A0A841TKV6_9BACL|nr:HD domain-containing protein [Cohnella lubricantis]MBB6679161.1 HD domain-containing protein [Cohnella lubricantis]MBP2119336.1 HD superfamily phosphohydrolase [Cohnella lubricantis]